jgi:hypothetical protein
MPTNAGYELALHIALHAHGEFERRIAALEAENAALWAFVRADDECNADEYMDGVLIDRLYAARDALRQYEEKGGGR